MLRGKRKEALLEVRDRERVAGDEVGGGARDGGGIGSVGARVGHGIGVIRVVVIAAATSSIGVEKQRVLAIGAEVGVVDRRTGRKRLGRHGRAYRILGEQDARRWRDWGGGGGRVELLKASPTMPNKNEKISCLT